MTSLRHKVRFIVILSSEVLLTEDESGTHLNASMYFFERPASALWSIRCESKNTQSQNAHNESYKTDSSGCERVHYNLLLPAKDDLNVISRVLYK